MPQPDRGESEHRHKHEEDIGHSVHLLKKVLREEGYGVVSGRAHAVGHVTDFTEWVFGCVKEWKMGEIICTYVVVKKEIR